MLLRRVGSAPYRGFDRARQREVNAECGQFIEVSDETGLTLLRLFPNEWELPKPRPQRRKPAMPSRQKGV